MARVMAVALDVMDRPWEWGTADCCTAACDVFERLYGIDPMAPLRGQYSSEAGAVRLIVSMGGFDQMAQTLADEAGLIDGVGQPGDIGVGINETRPALVICVAPGQWAGKTMTGFSTLRNVSRCWRA